MLLVYGRKITLLRQVLKRPCKDRCVNLLSSASASINRETVLTRNVITFLSHANGSMHANLFGHG